MEALLFDPKSTLNPDYLVFLNSPLGLLHQAIPFKELADELRSKSDKAVQGRKPFFTLEGGLALMFLKSYLRLSDEKLIERINTDWHLQYFCGIQLTRFEKISDNDIVGRWRRYISKLLNIQDCQDILAKHWKPYMEDTHIRMDDATCFESAIKYPSDVELLYDCACYLFGLLESITAILDIPMPRTKFADQHNKQKSYSMLKRKPKKRRRGRTNQLLKWVAKGLKFIQDILDQHVEIHCFIKDQTYKKIKLIRDIRTQQGLKYHNPDYKIRNRIVSLYKSYIRPIVRGKVNKLVEFGAKVHISQVDRINFIEHLSYEAFHEGIRMRKSIARHNTRFDECRVYAGDKIYANRANRKLASKKEITTSFVPLGRPAQTPSPLREFKKNLSVARSTILEGSFGHIKNNYLLGKVRARTQATETAWIFFAIHTANAVNISKRIAKKKIETVPIAA